MRLNIVASTLTSAIVVIIASGCGDSKSPTETESGIPKDTKAISVALCAPTSWAAHLDEGGQWTRVSIVNGKAVFNGTENQALAKVSDQGSLSIDVIYTTATTLNSLTCGVDGIGTKSISGSVANLAGMFANVSLGYATGQAGFSGANFNLYGVPDGALDLIATRSGGEYGEGAPDRMIHRRAQTLANGSNIALDFDAAEAFALESHTVTIAGAGTGPVVLAHEFRPAGGTPHMLQGALASAAATVMVPAAKLVDGDLHQTTAITMDATQGSRAIFAFYKDPADKVFTMGPGTGVPTMSNLAFSPVRLRAEIAAPAEYQAGAIVSWEQAVGNTYRSYSVTLLTDYLGAPPSKWTLDMPDLSKAAGFMPGWGLTQGSSEWAVELLGGSLEALIGNKAKDGDQVRFAVRSSDQSSLMAGAPAGDNPVSVTTRPIPRLFGRMR